MRFRVGAEEQGGRVVHQLFDDESGARASVLPSFGFNLFDLRLPAGGAVRPVLVSAPDFAANPRNPARNGTPVLFPFPNRVQNARYTFEGETYHLEVNSGTHAIHGFALAAPWDVLEHRATEAGATIVGRYQISKQSPEELDNWPTDAALEIRYTLAGLSLALDATVSNPSSRDLPYGFGIHPYYRLPLTPEGDRARTRIILPASRIWVLDGYIPTGETRPVDERLDFRRGRPIEGLQLDDVLTGIDPSDRVCRLVDEALRAEFRLGFDEHFRELVVYTPPDAPGVIAVEPYTQATDAINLQTRGIDAGLRILRHDQRETLQIRMETAG